MRGQPVAHGADRGLGRTLGGKAVYAGADRRQGDAAEPVPGGKLTMTPALGSQTQITGSTADTFTGARRLRSTNPASSAFLGEGDSFEIHGLFDMSSIPSLSGQSFGIRASDRSGTTDGKDVFQLTVSKSSTTGNIIVASRELDFGADTSEFVGAISIESFLATAEQIELIISKQASSDLVSASFNLFGPGATLLTSGTLDNINNVTGLAAQIYTDQDFTRAQFIALDTEVPIPEPGSLPLLGVSLLGLAYLRRRKAA